MLPAQLKKFFWEAPIETIDPDRNKRYVISRLLELGDEPAVTWLEHEYSKEDLRREAEASRTLSLKSRNYWKIKYRRA